MKTAGFIIATSFCVIAISCNKAHNPEHPSFPEKTYRTFTLSFSGCAATPAAGDTIRYYTSDEGEIKSAAIEQDGNVLAVKVECKQGSGYVAALYGGTTVGAHSRSSVTFLDMIPGTQDGTAEKGATCVACADLQNSQLRFEPVTGTLSFTVSGTGTKSVRLSSNDHSCIHSFSEAEVSLAGNPISTGKGGSSIEIATPRPGTYHVTLLPGTLTDGVTFWNFDAAAELISWTELPGMMAIARGEDHAVGAIDTRSDSTPQPGIRYMRNDDIEITGALNDCRYMVPFSAEALYRGRHHECEFMSEDGAVVLQGGLLVPTATGAHTVVACFQYRENLWYFKPFKVEVYSESFLEMFIRAKEGLPATYGNSEVILSHNGQQPLTFTFGVRVNIEPLFGQTRHEWLFPEQQLSLQPGEEAVLSDYSKLSSIVKKHLTASFSVDIFLNREDEYQTVHFNAENIRRNLKHSLDRTIPFTYNGDKLW